LKRECLNTFLCFSLRQLDFIVQAYADYHNKFRPHQGLGNRPPGTKEESELEVAALDPGSVQYQSWLGGLLKHYQRKAA
jgi:transposase InsO family protein